MTSAHNADLSPETRLIQALFEAINRNDIDAAAAWFDPDIERIEPPGFPSAGTYRGHAVVRDNLAQGRATWAEGSCDPEAFFQKDARVVVYLHVRVRLQGAETWIDARFADGFEIRAGKVIRYLSFGTRAESLAWAGLSS